MKTILACLLVLLTLSACATTVPTVEEGWVPLDEWNYRVSHTNPLATFMQAIQGSRADAGTVRTSCYASRGYTRCTSYSR